MSDGITKRAGYLLDLSQKANTEYIRFWINNIFLTWRWWLCVVLVVISWSLWFIFHKKESTYRLLLAGVVVMIISDLLNAFGSQAGLWSYNIDIDPFSPAFITFDLSLLPIATMTFLQYKPNINPIIKASIYSGIATFIAQPIFAWLGIYNRNQWKDYYSFPIFIIIYLIAHFFATREYFDKL
ncbi:MAG TPA: CBO0543 family protein [Candidatus Paceibacterota bacterium]